MADLVKFADKRISNNTELSTFLMEVKQNTICLFPETVQFVDPALKFGAAVVSVDLALDAYGNNKDIYRNESGGYCLHLSKINEISQHAGIQIIDSKILERKVDQNGRVTFIEHQVRGRLRYVDGSIKEDVATGKYDYYRDREKYLKDGKPNEKQINSRRNHAEALAESNAKTRLYNKLNFKLPSSFTLDELKKPILVPFIIEDKDALLSELPKEDQIQLRKELARKRLGISNSIYHQSPEPETVSYEVVSDDDKKTPAYQPQQPEEVDLKAKNKIIAAEFKDSPQKERTDKVLNLVKLTNYNDPNGIAVTAARVEKQTVDNQIAFIEKLLNLQTELQSAEAPL